MTETETVDFELLLKNKISTYCSNMKSFGCAPKKICAYTLILSRKRFDNMLENQVLSPWFHTYLSTFYVLEI